MASLPRGIKRPRCCDQVWRGRWLSAACMACELGGVEGRSVDFDESLASLKVWGLKCRVWHLPSRCRPWLGWSLTSWLSSSGTSLAVLRTHALREARRDGSRCDQETQTEATMVLVQIFLETPKFSQILLADPSANNICSYLSNVRNICALRWRW